MHAITGTVSREFLLLFFMILNYLGNLCLSIFAYGLDFAEIFACEKKPQCHWHRRVKLRGVTDTAESSSIVSLILQSQAPWCNWYRRVKLRGVIDTAESSSAVTLIPQSQAPRWHWYCRIKKCLVFLSWPLAINWIMW